MHENAPVTSGTAAFWLTVYQQKIRSVRKGRAQPVEAVFGRIALTKEL